MQLMQKAGFDMQAVRITREHLKKKKQTLIESDPKLALQSDDWNKEYEFRKKIVLAPQEAGIKQKDIEHDTGIAQRAISRLESDMDISPNIKTVIKYLSSIGYELDVVKVRASN